METWMDEKKVGREQDEDYRKNTNEKIADRCR